MSEKKKNLKLDNSCTSNSKSEIADWTGRSATGVQFRISDFEFEVQELSNFKISKGGGCKPPHSFGGVSLRAAQSGGFGGENLVLRSA